MMKLMVVAGLPVAVVTGLLVGVLLGVAMLAVVIACLKRSVSTTWCIFPIKIADREEQSLGIPDLRAGNFPF